MKKEQFKITEINARMYRCSAENTIHIRRGLLIAILLNSLLLFLICRLHSLLFAFVSIEIFANGTHWWIFLELYTACEWQIEWKRIFGNNNRIHYHVEMCSNDMENFPIPKINMSERMSARACLRDCATKYASTIIFVEMLKSREFESFTEKSIWFERIKWNVFFTGALPSSKYNSYIHCLHLIQCFFSAHLSVELSMSQHMMKSRACYY